MNPESMKIQDLKTDPEMFEAVWNGEKTFEIRFDDRNFMVGNTLYLRETVSSGADMKDGKPLVYTHRQIRATVSYILRGPIYGLKKGWVILSLQNIRNVCHFTK